MRLTACALRFARMSSVELRNLTYDELIERALRLEGQVLELRGQISNLQGVKPTKKINPPDFSKFAKRRIALKILYMGWDYSGLARQEVNKSTIAEKLLDAFTRCRMLENSSTAGFAVCGRTDKGVSGLSQVVTLTLRSNVHSGIGVICPENTDDLYPEKPEYDYVFIGNRNLPPEIRILAWCPVPLEFSPRHDCTSRSYKYFFPAADLNIDIMRKAAAKLEGQHDFRNFCTSQVANGVVNHERVIYSVTISDKDEDKTDPRRFCCLDIRGSSFLYHQIRCIVSLLVTIGRGLEPSELIDCLLDVQQTPAKPQYQMAEPEPLLFFEPEFQNLEWQTSPAAQEDILRTLQTLWTKLSVRAKVAETMLKTVEQCSPNNYTWAITHEAPSIVREKRKPILKRSTEETLEERVKKLEAKRANMQCQEVADTGEDGD
uniref:tRNA pseudouridine synthase n=2 Tax=Mesocestoides corti TaxID=53468 RepID=A0A5K3F2C8_MESCO